MGIKNASPYDMAIENFNTAVSNLVIDPGIVKKLMFPERCLLVSIPVRMDDSHVEVFKGMHP